MPTLIKTTDYIEMADDFLHDCTINVNGIQMQDSTLVLPYRSPVNRWGVVLKKAFKTSTLLVPLEQCYLRVHQVKDYTVVRQQDMG
ncbi:MAG: hypothetical protein ACYDBB_25600 [Armatimonadota bacterium]